MNADLTSLLLRRIVRALPGRRAEWGEAMQADLAAIDGTTQRWRFVLGCAAVVMRAPTGVLALGWLLVRGALLATAITLAWAIRVPGARVEAIGAVLVLLAGFGLLRSRVGFGRVSAVPAVRLVAAGGALTVAAEAMMTFHQLRAVAPLKLLPNATTGVYDSGRAGIELVVLVVVLGVFLIALAAVTAGTSPVSPGTVSTAASVAGAACLVWLVLVLLDPSVSTVGSPLLAVEVAGAGAAALAGRRRQRSGPRTALSAGLLAAAGTAYLIGAVMDLLTLTGDWVSNNAPPSSATPGPTRMVDTVVVYLPGVVLALTLAIVATLKRLARRSPTAISQASSANQVDQSALPW